MQYLCECNSWDCDRPIELDLETAKKLAVSSDLVIVDGCPTGPSPNLALVEKKEGYSVYRLKEA